MKIKCCKCGKIVAESRAIKQGLIHFCSDKCSISYFKSNIQSFWWTMGVIIGVGILFILFLIIVT